MRTSVRLSSVFLCSLGGLVEWMFRVNAIGVPCRAVFTALGNIVCCTTLQHFRTILEPRLESILTRYIRRKQIDTKYLKATYLRSAMLGLMNSVASQ